MAEYLEREAVLQIINTVNETGGFARYDDYSALFDEIDTMPTTDVQPVRRGEWEIFWQNGKPKLKCTNCHSLFDIRTNDKHICIYPKFCEECGADMRGERNDDR